MTFSFVTCLFQAIKILCKCVAYFPNSWIVQATMDPIFCNATVDFNVPGKPNPPPVKLAATIWTQSHFMPTGIVEKYAIEFTHLFRGTLASPGPLNTWVQIEDVVTKIEPGTPPKSCIQGSPLVFKDQHDGDSKLVTLSGNRLTVTPFESDDRLPTFLSVFSDARVF